jgi:hypothetical protein
MHAAALPGGTMANLEPGADQVVRDAVDAFMDGRFIPDFFGETVFETKNSRYRLLDGVVFSAPDDSLVGAELVGWLCESQRRCLVESAWQPGSRAVLVDRARGRNIIVTSTTQILHAEEPGSGSYQGGSLKSHSDFRSWHPPPQPGPPVRPVRPPTVPPAPFPPQRAVIIASTPPPVGVSLSPLPPAPAPAKPHPTMPPPLTLPTRLPLPSTTPFGSSAAPVAGAARRGAVHAPPRPMPSRPSPEPPLRPLPAPLPPPRRPSPVPPPFLPLPPLRLPAPPQIDAAGAWELTSGEFEMESDTAEPSTRERPEPDAPRHDAADPGLEPDVPFELSRPSLLDADPVNSEPFPLVRPVAPAPSRPPSGG